MVTAHLSSSDGFRAKKAKFAAAKLPGRSKTKERKPGSFNDFIDGRPSTLVPKLISRKDSPPPLRTPPPITSSGARLSKIRGRIIATFSSCGTSFRCMLKVNGGRFPAIHIGSRCDRCQIPVTWPCPISTLCGFRSMVDVADKRDVPSALPCRCEMMGTADDVEARQTVLYNRTRTMRRPRSRRWLPSPPSFPLSDMWGPFRGGGAKKGSTAGTGKLSWTSETREGFNNSPAKKSTELTAYLVFFIMMLATCLGYAWNRMDGAPAIACLR
jgi:hypothetical protein